MTQRSSTASPEGSSSHGAARRARINHSGGCRGVRVTVGVRVRVRVRVSSPNLNPNPNQVGAGLSRPVLPEARRLAEYSYRCNQPPRRPRCLGTTRGAPADDHPSPRAHTRPSRLSPFLKPAVRSRHPTHDRCAAARHAKHVGERGKHVGGRGRHGPAGRPRLILVYNSIPTLIQGSGKVAPSGRA